MKAKIVDIGKADAYTQAGYKDKLIGCTGEFDGLIPDSGWVSGSFILDTPIEIENEICINMYFQHVKIEPIVKQVKSLPGEQDLEFMYDVLWYHDAYVVAAFSCVVSEVIQNPERMMTIATVMINNKKTGEIVTRTGIAIRNPKDKFDFVYGRRKATGRAINTYPHKEQRKLLWSWYWTAVNNATGKEA